MLVGTLLADRYDILELLGAGGMGEVYRARDRELDELVALKVIRTELAGDAVQVEQFRHEVKLARRVTHGNVARTFELGRAGDVVFCTMELIDGESLTGRLARGPLPVAEAVAIARAVCDGLAAAHAAGVVHRDVKPDNVLIAGDGRVVVADFGVAAVTVERRGELSGTIAYMAPEQSLGEPPTPRADVYSVGVVLHEMLTGRRAFTGNAAAILDAKQLLGHVATPVGGAIDADLAAVVAAATARDVAARTPSADALRRALARWANQASAPAPAPARIRAGAAIAAEHQVIVVAPGAVDHDRAHLVHAVHDALLGKLARTPRLRVLARSATTDAALGSHVVALASDGTLTVRRIGTGIGIGIGAGADRPVVELALPLAVDLVATAADAGAAAVVAAIALSGPGTPDRAGAAYELWLRARHVTQLSMGTLDRTLALLEDAARLAPDDPRIIATLAMALCRRAFFDAGGDPASVERANALARRALATAPEVAETHLAVGHLELNIGEPAVAAGHFRVAIARAPQLAEGHEYLGRMLLEANYHELATARLHEAIAIAPHLMSARWEMARAHALAGQWDDYDRVVDELGDWSSSRAVALARFAMWRGDPGQVEQTRERLRHGDVTLAPKLVPQMYEVFLDPSSWERHRADFLATALDPRPPNRRRRAFIAQLAAETAANVGDTDVTVRCILHAVDNGLFDLAWLERCPLLVDVVGRPELADARVRVKARAEAILDALYGDQELRTVAETVFAG